MATLPVDPELHAPSANQALSGGSGGFPPGPRRRTGGYSLLDVADTPYPSSDTPAYLRGGYSLGLERARVLLLTRSEDLPLPARRTFSAHPGPAPPTPARWPKEKNLIEEKADTPYSRGRSSLYSRGGYSLLERRIPLTRSEDLPPPARRTFLFRPAAARRPSWLPAPWTQSYAASRPELLRPGIRPLARPSVRASVSWRQRVPCSAFFA